MSYACPLLPIPGAKKIDPKDQEQAARDAYAKYQAATAAYQQALTALAPTWTRLPTAPYPPAGDDSNFPSTGDISLLIDPTKLSQYQKNEPALVTKNLYDQSVARRPKPNALFFVGIACLAGYWLVRR